MAFIFGSPDFGAPTLDASTIPVGQPVGASYLPGAPSPSVSLNSGITFQPPSSGGSRFGDPNTFGPPADVTFAANPVNTAGLFGSVPTAGAFGGVSPVVPAGATGVTTKTATTDTSTQDALNRLIDLAAQQSSGGGGGGGIVALPTGIADTGAASGGGISPVAIVIVVAIIAGGLWYFHKKNKAAKSA